MSNLDLYLTDPKAYLFTELETVRDMLGELLTAWPTLPTFKATMHLHGFEPATIIVHPRDTQQYQEAAQTLTAAGWSFNGIDHISEISGTHLHDFHHPAYSFRFQIQATPEEVGEILTVYEVYQPDAGDLAD